jgi:hypothetical protein
MRDTCYDFLLTIRSFFDIFCPVSAFSLVCSCGLGWGWVVGIGTEGENTYRRIWLGNWAIGKGFGVFSVSVSVASVSWAPLCVLFILF